MPKKTISVTKPFTLETFMKQATKLKITTNVLEDFIRALDELATKITKTSETSAIKEQRKTIMPQDLEKALDEILKRGPLTVDELLQKIKPLSITELTDLSKKIKKMADELLKPTGFGYRKPNHGLLACSRHRVKSGLGYGFGHQRPNHGLVAYRKPNHCPLAGKK